MHPNNSSFPRNHDIKWPWYFGWFLSYYNIIFDNCWYMIYPIFILLNITWLSSIPVGPFQVCPGRSSTRWPSNRRWRSMVHRRPGRPSVSTTRVPRCVGKICIQWMPLLIQILTFEYFWNFEYDHDNIWYILFLSRILIFDSSIVIFC